MTDETPIFYRDFFSKPSPREVVGRAVDPSRAAPYAAKAINDELNALATAAEGRRNDQLNASAFNLAQLVAGGYADHAEVYDLLRSTALAIGLTAAETTKTLHSAFDAGQRQPRVVADLDSSSPPPVTVLHYEEPKEDEDPGETIESLFPRLDWHDLWAKEEEDEWIVYPLIPARRLVALFSPPKVGKSLLMLELAVQISRGHTVLGQTPKPRRVLYVDFENDPRGDIRSRLKAMGVTPYQLDDLVYLSFPSLAYLDTAMGGMQLMACVEHYETEVTVIDTVGRAVGGEENSNDTWLGFYKNTGMRMKAAKVACVRLDHTGKDETKGMRGGSAKYGDVDAVWSMSRVDEDTYKLECTANRLPIGEKVLVLKRETTPHLLHRVDAAGEAAIWKKLDEDRIAVLDAKFGKDRPTHEAANAVIKAALGKGVTPRNIGRLLDERDRRNAVVVLDDGPDYDTGRPE
jgi:hypothetical protein